MRFSMPERGGGVALARVPANFASFRGLSSALRVCAFAEPPQKMGVAIAPGEIEFTRMPLGPSFAPAIRVIWLTAAFAAEYSIPPWPRRCAAMLELLIMEPPPLIARAAGVMPDMT